jgi:hypothetical protein
MGEFVSRADAKAQQAALNAVDPDRLLEGEDPTTPHPEEARHWIDTYEDLLRVKERLLTTVNEAVEEPLEKPAAREVESTDGVTLRAEHARFKRRLDFWKRRLDELQRK